MDQEIVNGDANEKPEMAKWVFETLPRETRYFKLLNAVSKYTYTVHLKNSIPVRTEHSPGCVEVCGYTPEEFYSNPYLWIRMVQDEDKKKVEEHASQILSGKAIAAIEHRIVRKDGAIRWVRNTHVLYRDKEGRALFYDGVIEDITERKETEMIRSFLSSIVESSEDGIIGLTMGGVITAWNKAAERIFGYAAQELLGKSIYLLHQQKNIESILRIIERVNKEMKSGLLESVVTRPDGTQIDVALVASPIRSFGEDVITGVSIIVRDISERKRLEREVLEASEREQQRIGQDLHDGLCQELVSIAFMCQIMENKLSECNLIESNCPEISKMSQIIKLLNRAVKETRGFSRRLSLEDLEAGGLIDALKALVSNLESIYEVSCSFECSLSVNPSSQIAAIYLYRIAHEALYNAIRHGKAKKVKISLSDQPHRIFLTIQDDGLGFQEYPVQKKGLGLKSMRNRARLLGGSLKISNNKNGGASVVCSIPKSAYISEEMSPPAP